MVNIKRIFCSLIIILTIVFFFSSMSIAEENRLKSLKDSIYPDRIKLTQKTVQQDKELRQRVVFMSHSSFILNRSYVPRLEKAEGHILLQLSRPLNFAIEENLKQHGVELLEYIPTNTWKAKIPTAALMDVKALDFVYAMGKIYPVDKFPKHVLERDFNSYTYNNDGTISVMVTFHKDIPFNRVLKILTELSGTTDQENFITGQRLLLRVPEASLRNLAEYDEVNWIEDRPTPKMINNIDAAAISNINDVQATPYNLDGSGIKIGEWDGGEVKDDHADLAGRVIVIDAGIDNGHATHVAGTMISSGSNNADAKGMAPSATLYSFDINGDVLLEMSSAVSTYGIMLSNNSWVLPTGWVFNAYKDDKWVWYGGDFNQVDSNFGAYTSESQAWDQNLLDTSLIIVKAAGNDRYENGDQDLEGHWHYQGKVNLPSYHTDCLHDPDGDHPCIGQIASAKNIIVVGAVDDYGAMSTFSSWGPVNDGRIKPDIVANGVGLTSTWLNTQECKSSGTFEDYCSMRGTSMSTPVATGAIALLIQRYRDVYGTEPSPAIVKAAVINTASELGTKGPDYRFGWGLLDTRAAVDLMDGGHTYLKTDSISNGETAEYTLNVSSLNKVLKVTMAWSDPAGTPGAAKALVNDIDLELADPSKSIHKPWILDKSNPSAAATRGINSLDNVEQVLVNFPQEGIWTIRILGTSIQGSQPFALAISLIEEFQVNTYADYFQEFPSVAGLAGGGFVVTWDSRGILAGSTDVYGQRFDLAGNPVGGEFLVNTYSDDNQENSAVAGLAGGGFVVTWESKDQDGNNYGVYGQRFDSAGDPVGGEFQVNTHTNFRQEHPAVAGLVGGGFVVTWDSDLQDGNGDGIYGQVFDSSGDPVGGEFQVNTHSDGYQDNPAVAGLSGGGFVVTWESGNQDGSGDGVYGQVFDSAADPLGEEFQVNTYTSMSQKQSAVAALSGGGFVVTWTSFEQDGDGDGVYGQVFDSAGNTVNGEFQVSTYSDDDQQYPSVAALSSGGFAVLWESYGQDGNSEGVFGKLFDSAANPVGEEFQVNAYMVHSQNYPSVVQLSGGGFVVAWESAYQDGSASGIFGKRFAGAEACECDFEPDGDVDGSDLAAYIADQAGINLGDIAEDFGRTDCQ
jgi:subtilisin family serine protease